MDTNITWEKMCKFDAYVLRQIFCAIIKNRLTLDDGTVDKVASIAANLFYDNNDEIFTSATKVAITLASSKVDFDSYLNADDVAILKNEIRPYLSSILAGLIYSQNKDIKLFDLIDIAHDFISSLLNANIISLSIIKENKIIFCDNIKYINSTEPLINLSLKIKQASNSAFVEVFKG